MRGGLPPPIEAPKSRIRRFPRTAPGCARHCSWLSDCATKSRDFPSATPNPPRRRAGCTAASSWALPSPQAGAVRSLNRAARHRCVPHHRRRRAEPRCVSHPPINTPTITPYYLPADHTAHDYLPGPGPDVSKNSTGSVYGMTLSGVPVQAIGLVVCIWERSGTFLRSYKIAKATLISTIPVRSKCSEDV